MRKYILVIILAGLAVYANSAFNGFVWDDEFLILKNPSIMSWGYSWMHFVLDLYHSFSNYYRPVQMITYMWDFSLWRLDPFGYHLTNIFLHVTASVLLFLFIFMITKDKRPAVIGAVLYVVHPANTGAVAYVAGRADILAAIFTLASFILLQFHFKARAAGRVIVFYAASLAAFLAALLSKEISIITPLPIFLYCLFFVDERDIRRSRDVIKFNYLSWFLIIAGVYLILRVHALNFQELGIFESKYALYSRLLTFMKAIMVYMGIIFFPVGLHMERSIPYAVSFWENGVLLSAAGLLIVMWAVIRIKRMSKEAFFGIVFFFTALLPVSNILPMSNNLAEHWLYVPLMGMSLSVAVLGVYLWDNRKTPRPGLAFLFSFYFIFFSYQTVDRNLDWREDFTIYYNTIKYCPDSIKILNNIGNLYHRSGNSKKSLEFHKKAVAINPREHRTRINLGIDYEGMGNIEEAMKQYELSRELRPDYAQAYLHIADIYMKRGAADEAAAFYKIAVRYDEFNIDAHNKLGNIYFDKGAYEESGKEYKKILEIDPYAAGAHNNLANVFAELGLNEKALMEYEKAVELDAKNAEYLFNLGTEYGRECRYDEAIAALKEAWMLAPQRTATLINLGAAYFYKGDTVRAEMEWGRALRVDPGNEIAKNYLKKMENSSQSKD